MSIGYQGWAPTTPENEDEHPQSPLKIKRTHKQSVRTAIIVQSYNIYIYTFMYIHIYIYTKYINVLPFLLVVVFPQPVVGGVPTSGLQASSLALAHVGMLHRSRGVAKSMEVHVVTKNTPRLPSWGIGSNL